MSRAPVPGERRLRIVNQLDPALSALLAAHWSQPQVLTPAAGARPWEIAPDADAVVTAPSAGWAAAPAQAPAGWPGRARWIHTVSAGVDALPHWIGRGAVLSCGRGVAAAAIARYVMDAITRRTPQPQGTTLGLAGWGAIGQAVAAQAQQRGMQVLALRRRATPAEPGPVRFVGSFDALIAGVDHLVLALPLTPATRHLVHAGTLARSRRGLHLINVARGGLVAHDALAAALDSGQLGHVTLDVTEPEPLPADHWLACHPAVRITPHLAWQSEDHLQLRNAQVLDNLSAFARGMPLAAVVDAEAGY